VQQFKAQSKSIPHQNVTHCLQDGMYQLQVLKYHIQRQKFNKEVLDGSADQLTGRGVAKYTLEETVPGIRDA
jgi:hypothetical protein